MEFGILGPVEAWVDGRPADAGHARQRAVLAVLLLDLGRAVPLEALIDRVWGEDPPRSVRNVIYGHVARLKTLVCSGQDPRVSLSRGTGGYLLQAAGPAGAGAGRGVKVSASQPNTRVVTTTRSAMPSRPSAYTRPSARRRVRP
jgi:Transcriptional regulatory protein, C terminal